MPRRRGRMRMRMNPIQSVKNQHSTKQTILANTNIQDFVMDATEQGVPTKVVGIEVPVGAIIYSMDISVNFVVDGGGSTGTLDWMFIKLRDGQVASTIIPTPDWSDIGLSSGRNQVIKSYMCVYGTEDGGAKTWNVHIKIPKVYQRTRSGDRFVIVVNSNAAGTLATGARYKYYQ